MFRCWSFFPNRKKRHIQILSLLVLNKTTWTMFSQWKQQCQAFSFIWIALLRLEGNHKHENTWSFTVFTFPLSHKEKSFLILRPKKRRSVFKHFKCFWQFLKNWKFLLDSKLIYFHGSYSIYLKGFRFKLPLQGVLTENRWWYQQGEPGATLNTVSINIYILALYFKIITLK